ncbi:hypothetical protein, partial [Vibrio vulnificus]|uniref:hypothetical protein n=1 Tax=Vibrio vulnificus TaxID=672 RepID=UPI0039C9A147
MAFLVCGEFCGESGLQKLGLCGIHPLTRRYATQVNLGVQSFGISPAIRFELSAFFKVVVIIRLVIKRLFFLDLDEPHQRVHSSL